MTNPDSSLLEDFACPQCGYAMSGSAAGGVWRCPECGIPLSPADASDQVVHPLQRQRKRKLIRVVISILVFLVAIYCVGWACWLFLKMLMQTLQ